MNANVLTLLPGKIRFGLYVAYGVAGVLYYAVSAAYLADPAWLDGVSRVLQALLVPFAALAATHVTQTSDEAAEVETPELGTSLAEREAIETPPGEQA